MMATKRRGFPDLRCPKCGEPDSPLVLSRDARPGMRRMQRSGHPRRGVIPTPAVLIEGHGRRYDRSVKRSRLRLTDGEHSGEKAMAMIAEAWEVALVDRQ